MAWRLDKVEEKRKAFIDDCLNGKRTMADNCRVYDISRKTGYKWLDRYNDDEEGSLKDRSRAPLKQALITDPDVVRIILQVRCRYPKWGPKKVSAWLKINRPEITAPSTTTIGNIFNRNGLTISRKFRRRVPGKTAPLSHCKESNDVWCTDFKGWFLTGDGNKCEPFTLTDGASRYLLRCVKLIQNDTNHVWGALEAAFYEYGLPLNLRHDNGPPFATCGAGRLSRLSIKLIKAGVCPEWIDPGKPQQNGRHERMHQTLKSETASPPEDTLILQDIKFGEFQEYYNFARPHEGIGLITPGSIYKPSKREWNGILKSPEYDSGCDVRLVRPNGSIKWKGSEIYIGGVLAGEPISLTETGDNLFIIHYGSILLGTMAEDRIFRMPDGNRRRRSCNQRDKTVL
jgi:putative transposase